MDPLQKSLGQKALYQGVALATLFCATKSSRLISYLPNFSKNGLLLLEGTLITSSFLHDIYRRQHPEHSYPIEKGIFMGISSLAASYAIAKYSETLSPQLVLTATAMTFLFSLGVSKISALSPIEIKHYAYCKNPQALSVLKKEDRIKLAKEFLAAGLPFVPGFVGYQEKMQGVFPQDERVKMYQNPQNYSKNHLSWLLGLTKAPFKISHETFIQHVIENGIPIYAIDREGNYCPDQFYETNPIYAHIDFDTRDFRLKENFPTLDALVTALNHDVVEKMPPHLAYAWFQALRYGMKFGDLGVYTRYAFCVQFSRMNLDWKIKTIVKHLRQITDFNQLTCAELLVKKELMVGVHQIEHSDEVKEILSYLKGGIIPPLFKIEFEVPSNASYVKELRQFYQKHPIYFHLSDSGNLKNLGVTVPSLKELKEALTRQRIQNMSRDEFLAWERASWNLVSYPNQLAFLQRYEELKIYGKRPKIEEIITDMTQKPSEYTASDVTWVIGTFRKHQGIVYVDNLNELKLFEIAKEKGVDFPLFCFHFKNDQIAELLPKILEKKPIYWLASETLYSYAETNKLQCPPFSDLVKGLTPESIEKMTPDDIFVWHRALGQVYSHILSENSKNWGRLEDSIKLSFVKRFIELDFCGKGDLQFIAGDVSWLDLRLETIKGLTKNQLFWYRSLLFKPEPPNFENTIIDDDLNKLHTIIQKLTADYVYGQMVPSFCTLHQDRKGLVQPQIENALIEALKKMDREKCAYDQDHFNQKFRSGIEEHAFLIDPEKLEILDLKEEELFLRNQFKKEVVIPLTNRYVEGLSKGSEDVPHLIELLPDTHEKAGFAKLTPANQEKLKTLFGDQAHLL